FKVHYCDPPSLSTVGDILQVVNASMPSNVTDLPNSTCAKDVSLLYLLLLLGTFSLGVTLYTFRNT
ncbi:unnamed protein product, partial [Candidula unifasciata]